MSERTMAELVPMRPIRVVWEDDPEAQCEWCGRPTTDDWVLEAEPVPERFCSAMCVVQDTGTCWSPSPEMEEEAAKNNG